MAENAPKNKIEEAATKTAKIRPHLPHRGGSISMSQDGVFFSTRDTPWEGRIEHLIGRHRGDDQSHK